MYTIKEAAARSGLSVPTVRAWERRYGVVQPQRTASGYRLYDSGSIDRLIAMRSLVEHEGLRPKQAAEQVIAGSRDLAELVREANRAEREVADGSSTAIDEDARPGGEIRAFVDATRRLDVPGLERILDEAFASERFESAMEHIAFPAMRAVGQAWADGSIDVAMEHVASETVRRRLAGFFEAIPSRPGPDVLVGLPPGGHHELGALAFAVAARRGGLSVVYLGADVPVSGWLSAAESTRAAIAVIGVVGASDLAPAIEVIASLRQTAPPPITVVGGASVNDLGDPAEVTRLPDSLDRAVEIVAELLARRA